MGLGLGMILVRNKEGYIDVWHKGNLIGYRLDTGQINNFLEDITSWQELA